MMVVQGLPSRCNTIIRSLIFSRFVQEFSALGERRTPIPPIEAFIVFFVAEHVTRVFLPSFSCRRFSLWKILCSCMHKTSILYLSMPREISFFFSAFASDLVLKVLIVKGDFRLTNLSVRPFAGSDLILPGGFGTGLPWVRDEAVTFALVTDGLSGAWTLVLWSCLFILSFASRRAGATPTPPQCSTN